jgi:trimeric autotransporter adhesin
MKNSRARLEGLSTAIRIGALLLAVLGPLTAAAAPVMQWLSVSPYSVMGGQGSTGTVTLSASAPSGGVVVSLASSTSAAQVPASVTVAAGSTKANFGITTSAVTSATQAIITGTTNGTSMAAPLALTVVATAPAMQWVSVSPASVAGGQASTGAVTLSAPAPSGGTSVGLASSSAAAQVPASVTVAAGKVTASFGITTSAGTTTTQAIITGTTGGTSMAATLTVTGVAGAPVVQALSVSPASVTGGQGSTGTVTLSASAPSGGTTVSLASSSAAAQVPASVVVAAGSVSATFGITTSAVTSATQAIITGTAGGTSRTATLTLTATASAPVVQALGVSPASVTGGQGSTGSVTLSGSAPSGGIAVGLTSSSAAAHVPASVTVAAGSTSATFGITTSAVATATQAIITGTAGGTSRTAALTLTAAASAPGMQWLSVGPTSVTGGQGSTGVVTLSASAPSGGTAVGLTSSSAAAQVPASVLVPAGSTKAVFGITTSAVTATTQAVVTGTSGGTSRGATLTVVATTAPAYGLSLSTSASRSGAVGLQGRTLSGPAYVFTSDVANPQQSAPAGISSVCFWLDNLAMSGTATRCAQAAPYDLAGSVGSLAAPWDTTKVADGVHSISQLVTLSAGGSEIDADEFTVLNVVPAIAVAVTPSPASTTVGGTIAFTAIVTGTTAGQSTAVSWSVSTGGGSIDFTTGVYRAPATAGTYTVTASSVADPAKTGSASVVVGGSSTGGTDLDRLRVLATKRIYFQHASVGAEICGAYDPTGGSFGSSYGLKKIITDNPGSGFRDVTGAVTAATIPVGTLGEVQISGLNGNPAGKLARFDAAVRGGLGGAMDYVILKLGYPDFSGGYVTGTQQTPAQWFAGTYKPTMDALAALYPGTVIIHFTAPLYQAASWWDNPTIEKFNALLRVNYPRTTFDLANFESRNAAGVQQLSNGYPCQNADWANGDNHLNLAGTNYMAGKFLAFLASLP